LLVVHIAKKKQKPTQSTHDWNTVAGMAGWPSR
jgi:hypothetical protein